MSSDKVAIAPAALPGGHAQAGCSPGLRSGDLLFVCGQVGRHADGRVVEDPEAQYVAAFEAVRLVLEGGGASFADVVDLQTYHTTFEDFALFTAVKGRYFTEGPFPAWTAIGTTGLVLPGLRAEVKCLARVP